jgi:hypothetical protein
MNILKTRIGSSRPRFPERTRRIPDDLRTRLTIHPRSGFSATNPVVKGIFELSNCRRRDVMISVWVAPERVSDMKWGIENKQLELTNGANTIQKVKAGFSCSTWFFGRFDACHLSYHDLVLVSSGSVCLSCFFGVLFFDDLVRRLSISLFVCWSRFLKCSHASHVTFPSFSTVAVPLMRRSYCCSVDDLLLLLSNSLYLCCFLLFCWFVAPIFKFSLSMLFSVLFMQWYSCFYVLFFMLLSILLMISYSVCEIVFLYPPFSSYDDLRLLRSHSLYRCCFLFFWWIVAPTFTFW